MLFHCLPPFFWGTLAFQRLENSVWWLLSSPLQRWLKNRGRAVLQVFEEYQKVWAPNLPNFGWKVVTKTPKTGPRNSSFAHTPLLCLEGFESDRKYYYFEKRMWFGVKLHTQHVVLFFVGFLCSFGWPTWQHDNMLPNGLSPFCWNLNRCFSAAEKFSYTIR